MSIAIGTSPDNAISTLSDLIAEVRDEMDDSTFNQERIYRAVGRAEARFNRELRIPQMETAVLLTSVDEYTALPNDFLQMRLIYQEGSPDSPLRPYSPAQLRQAYRGVTGRPCGYAIENRHLIIGPVGSTTLNMTYYQRIPALTDDNPVNWLIDEHPDLYLHQVLAILFFKIGDVDRSGAHQSIVTDFLDRTQAVGNAAAWGSGPLAPRMGCNNVRGVIV